jgi:hypothetical protein
MRHRRIRAGGRGRGSGGPALRAYLVEMRSLPKALMLALAAVLAFGTLDAASARAKKRHVKHPETPIVTRDYDGYAGSPPPLTQPPGVYRPPPINSFGDRVIDAIHAYPLEKGLGNNPADQQMFIRQRANQ